MCTYLEIQKQENSRMMYTKMTAVSGRTWDFLLETRSDCLLVYLRLAWNSLCQSLCLSFLCAAVSGVSHVPVLIFVLLENCLCNRDDCHT